MANHYFKFKQFTIIQEKAAMKVGTDGVLLGAWANCNTAKTILDIGTGTGLIALMLAQRCNATIDAIEIDSKACNEAKLNVQTSPWQQRINIINNSIQLFQTSGKYDLIVSNPPFFTKSYKAKNDSRTAARHDDNLSAIDLFASVAQLLHTEGIFCVIIPIDNHDNYLETALKFNLHCSKKLWLKPTPTKPVKRVLLSFKFIANNCDENEIIVEDRGRHQYSQEYKELTKDFYLYF